MIQVAVVYHSGYGHTAKLAEAVYQGVCSVPEVTGHLIKVEDIDAHWGDLEAADAIIFGAPTYMGSAQHRSKRLWMHPVKSGWSRAGKIRSRQALPIPPAAAVTN